jgi:ankyrin repeat protein
MPARALPDRPNLDQYRKQAKDLLRAFRAADPEAIARVSAHHPRLRARGAAADAVLQLADAQLVIAREHGDETWPAFAARIAAVEPATAAPTPVWKLAEDAVVRGDAEALAPLLRDHADALRGPHPSTWLGGLAPSYAEADARAIIAREHFFDGWDAFAAFTEAGRDPASPVARFEAAADAIVGGDLQALTRLLRDDPALVRARSRRRHRATLLHYAGSNGIEGFRQRTPTNIVAIAEALLDAGADVDATAQMYGSDDTTIGLAATSIHPVTAGVLEPLLALLLSRGATVGGAGGGAAWSRLINGCHANGRPAAAEFLAARAAERGLDVDLDLEAAAGVGRLDLVERHVAPDGSLIGATPEQARDAFTWACEYGRTAVVDVLLRRGQAVDAKLPRHHGQTGLHWAAWGAHVDTVRTLLAAGASVDIRDDRFGGTALGWALHAWSHGGPAPDPARYVDVARLLVGAGAVLDREWLEQSGRGEAWTASLPGALEMRRVLGV